MSNFKRGLEDKSKWLVHQDLIEYFEGRTIGMINVLKERKGRGVLLTRRFYTMPSVVVFYSQVRVYTMNVIKLFYFYVVRQSKVFTDITNRTDCHFMRCFIPKREFTPWTEKIIARFSIEEYCFELEETEWIVMQNRELRACSSLWCSSRYRSWREIYFWLKYE